MNFNIANKNDEMVMALIHYFITEENYTPIVVYGVKDEIWLENLEGPYGIIRINSNYIYNKEQYDLDLFRTSKLMNQIKKKTFSLNMHVLNILVNVSDNVTELEDKKNISCLKIKKIENITEDKDIADIFPKIKTKLLKDKVGIDLVINVTNDINAKTMRDNEAYTKVFKPKKIIITPILIFLCVLAFLAMYILGNGSEDSYTLVLFGANTQKLVKAGQVWRLITSMFLHIGVIHLVCNMYALWVLGRQMENFLGKFKFLIVYLGSGFIGSLLSIVINGNSISAGASGAIFGLVGSLLYFGYHYRLYLGSVLLSQVIPITLLNLFIGFAVEGIDVYAHLGGLASGYLLTMALGLNGKTKKSERINGIIVIAVLVFFLFYMLWR